MKTLKLLVEKVSRDFPYSCDGIHDFQLDYLQNIWKTALNKIYERIVFKRWTICHSGSEGGKGRLRPLREAKSLCDFPDSQIFFFFLDWWQNLRYGTEEGDLKKNKKYIAVLLSWRDKAKYSKGELSGLRADSQRVLHWEEAPDIWTEVALSFAEY